MARKIWHYTLTPEEQKLWDTEGMEGWRTAMEACVEDDAREQGCKKYVLYDTSETAVAKGDVSTLPEPVSIH